MHAFYGKVAHIPVGQLKLLLIHHIGPENGITPVKFSPCLGVCCGIDPVDAVDLQRLFTVYHPPQIIGIEFPAYNYLFKRIHFYGILYGCPFGMGIRIPGNCKPDRSEGYEQIKND